MNIEEYLDKSQLAEIRELSEGNDNLLIELLETFVETAQGLYVKLEQACTENDIEAMARLFHRMKGSAASIGINTIRDLAIRGNEDCKAGKPGDLTGLVADIGAEINQAEIHLKDLKG